VRMTFQPAKTLAGVWQGILAKREDEQERKRIEHADRIRHALTVLESLRSWNPEGGKTNA
jgi:hypothetical protein